MKLGFTVRSHTALGREMLVHIQIQVDVEEASLHGTQQTAQDSQRENGGHQGIAGDRGQRRCRSNNTRFK